MDELKTLKAEHERAVAQRDRYRDHLYRRIIRDAAAEAIERAGGHPKALLPHVARQLAVLDTDDEKMPFRVEVIDPGTKKSRAGVSVDELLAEMRASPDYASVFDGKSEGSRSKKLVNNPWEKGRANATEQAKLLKNNRGLAIRMQREAGVLPPG